jgi:hypothetical protein
VRVPQPVLEHSSGHPCGRFPGRNLCVNTCIYRRLIALRAENIISREPALAKVRIPAFHSLSGQELTAEYAENAEKPRRTLRSRAVTTYLFDRIKSQRTESALHPIPVSQS